MTLLS